ncbi:hypothetical protein NDN08_007193 [Rhodosorus marinus]|uniref:F-box domain-containing protein n=1 Tax=Rhodosorus marinus TaxID=101924 RepID=A0AAV8UJ92_9RHOD|nr:hypothetical protein NDN08_007193 [Rhodosorus marinus]
MEGLGDMTMRRVVDFLPLLDRLNLALCSKSCSEMLEGKMEFFQAAVEFPQVMTFKDERPGRTPSLKRGLRWLVSGDGKVTAVVDWNFERGNIVIERFASISRRSTRRRLEIDGGRTGRAGIFKSDLSYSGSLLAFGFGSLNSRPPPGGETYEVYLVSMDGSEMQEIAFHEYTCDVTDIKISPSEEYVVVATRNGAMKLLSRSGEEVWSKNVAVNEGDRGCSVAFSKSGDLLFLSAGEMGARVGPNKVELWTCSAPLLEEVQLARLPERTGDRWQASLSNQNKLMYYDGNTGEIEVFQIDVQSAEYKLVFRTKLGDRKRWFSPEPLAYISYMQGNQMRSWVAGKFTCEDRSVGLMQRCFGENGLYNGLDGKMDRANPWITVGRGKFEESCYFRGDGGWCIFAYRLSKGVQIVGVTNLKPFLEAGGPWNLLVSGLGVMEEPSTAQMT